MKIQWKKLIVCLIIPLAVGGISAYLTRNSMMVYGALNKPFLSPPGRLFPVVWTILYVLMGIASYLVLTSGKPDDNALTIYGIQLIFNFFWSIIFFNMQLYLAAFIWLVLLWIMILKTVVMFFRISGAAGYMMLPYLVWVTFAGYLNFSVYLLN